jgi:hypothetical protein
MRDICALSVYAYCGQQLTLSALNSIIKTAYFCTKHVVYTYCIHTAYIAISMYLLQKYAIISTL